ncbi:zinc finger protein 585A-like isoform X2 [Zootermopsis nevadensis]|nr:zinc finger protein 585A-like isoform X2 [Zootermopsis nevadensis]XP_021929236.1 zinc finger protein 585A-like isoform X2 [Zootermopsis nevadensis]XP_021929237.1 zinc finger protein 585A-like isoform X2 [Zootermopsis nevadensis]
MSHFMAEEPREMSADLLCRVCACASEELVPVFGEKGLELQLLDKIHTHLPIMVTAEDLLPVNVCLDCIYRLEMCHEFVHGCLEADAKLREILCLDTDNEVYFEGYNEDECSTNQSPLEVTQELDNEQDTNVFGDSCDTQDGSSCDVEDTDMMSNNLDDSYAQDKYVIEDEADAQLDDYQNSTDHMPEEAAAVQSISEEVDESHSLETGKPKFTVVVVKMKNTSSMTQDAQIEKALDVLKNVQTSSQSVTEKQEFVNQETLEQPQKKELCLESSDTEPPDCLFDESSTMDHPVVSNEDTKPEPSVYDETFSTVFTENEVREEGIVQVDSRKVSVDHSYTHCDQTSYCCMYCKKTVVGKVNLASHQTVSHPDKVFCCPECDVIIYESKQFFEEHKKKHFRKSECGEGTFKANWLTCENYFEESKSVEPGNGNISVSEMFDYKKSEKDIETYKTGLLEVVVKSGTVLPSLKISEPDMAALHEKVHKQTDRQGAVEIVKVADIHVEPQRYLLKKGIFQSNLEFRVKISKNFKNIDSNDRSKITGIIRGIIKKLENERTKVVGTERCSRSNEVVQTAAGTEEISSQKAKRRIKHRHWRCKQCDHLSVSWEEHVKHIWAHPPVSLPCAYCDKRFSSKARLQFHASIHTQEKPFICEYCGKGFWNTQSLKNHLYTHDESEKMFECKHCGKKFGTRAGYDSHCASHTKASYLCDVCGKSMKHISSLRLHKLTHVDPTFFRRHCCAVCGKACRNRYLLTEHMRTHTNERPFKCLHCEECFHKRSQLSQHMLIHGDPRQHICSVCGKGFNRMGNLKMHAKTHQRSTKHVCKICKDTFTCLGELLSHRKMHTKEEVEEAMQLCERQGSNPSVYVCEVCGKQLASKLTLKYHMMSHDGDKPFPCETCGKKFPLKTKLQLHQKIHSSKRPYSCSFCNEGFQTKQYKIIHERIHTGEKPYKCTQCTKAFRSRMILNQHMLVHSDLRPFKCSLCDKGFRRRDTLDTHLRIHTGERPYSCNICGRGFKQKGDCNKHQRTHFKGRRVVEVEEAPVDVTFTCILCGLSFDQKEELYGHLEEFHTSDMIVASDAMVMNTEGLVSIPEIVQDDKTLIVQNFGSECDTS